MNQKLINFHLALGPDDAGRYITNIIGFTSDELEFTHDYIQWLFPLPEPSAYAPDAPLLDEETLAEFRTNENLTKSLSYCAGMMKWFYRFNNHWVNKNNHNYLRISRIIRCLALVGLTTTAKCFYDDVEALVKYHDGEVTPETLKYWEAATKGLLLNPFNHFHLIYKFISIRAQCGIIINHIQIIDTNKLSFAKDDGHRLVTSHPSATLQQ